MAATIVTWSRDHKFALATIVITAVLTLAGFALTVVLDKEPPPAPEIVSPVEGKTVGRPVKVKAKIDKPLQKGQTIWLASRPNPDHFAPVKGPCHVNGTQVLCQPLNLGSEQAKGKGITMTMCLYVVHGDSDLQEYQANAEANGPGEQLPGKPKNTVSEACIDVKT